MLSTFHGRSTTGLPRYDYWQRSRAPNILLEVFDEARDGESHAVLLDAGIRYVLWAPWIPHGDGGPDLESLTVILGPPRTDGALRWWRIDEED